MPDFGKLSRADAITQISAYQEALQAAGDGAAPSTKALGPMLNDYKALKNNVVPEAWL